MIWTAISPVGSEKMQNGIRKQNDCSLLFLERNWRCCSSNNFSCSSSFQIPYYVFKCSLYSCHTRSTGSFVFHDRLLQTLFTWQSPLFIRINVLSLERVNVQVSRSNLSTKDFCLSHAQTMSERYLDTWQDEKHLETRFRSIARTVYVWL